MNGRIALQRAAADGRWTNPSAWRGVLLLTLLAVGALALAQPDPAHAAVGRTAGAFAVSPTGAATYTIPIWAPRGPGGVQPHLALAYNSQSGNGYVGVGWNLAGLSSVYRCNLTYAQDAAPAPVTLSTSDGYCLDGQRLRLTSGTYGADGSTYQTEIANFELVTAHGSAGNGPASFTAKARNGVTYEYGNDSNGANSQVLAGTTGTALTWMLDKVSDPAGNTMAISYCPTGATQGPNCPGSGLEGTTVPSTISWTPISHGASTYSYTMTFSYGTNVLPPAGYVAGTPLENPYLLSAITIDSSGAQVKEYVLTYQQSATTSRDLLTQVQECSTSTSVCLAPTAISYQAGGFGVSGTPTVVSSSLRCPAAQYDFNGDGYPDLLCSDQHGNLYVAFGSSSGYGTPVSVGVPGGVVGDLLGDGQDGILAGASGTWVYYTWNGSSFSGVSTGIAVAANSQPALVDVNGDGLPDLVTLTYNSGASVTVYTRLNTSSGGTPSFSANQTTAYTGALGSGFAAYLLATTTPNGQPIDFNGDGLQDLAIEEYGCAGYYMGACMVYVEYINELLAQPGGTFSAFQLAALPIYPTNPPSYAVTFANVNNDACTDSIITTAGSSGTSSMAYISACNGNAAATIAPAYPIVSTIDWNGDGLADLLETDGTNWYVQLATATDFSAAQSISVPLSQGCVYGTIGANGDGLDDLEATCGNADGFTYTSEYYAHNDPGVRPDLLSSITDGYGNSASPAYTSIVQGNYSNKTWATFPYENWVGPLYVVSEVTLSDPSKAPSGTFDQTYWYADAVRNLQGRGFMGFASVQQTDSRSGICTTLAYATSFPQAGLVSEDIRSANCANTELITDTSNTLSTTTLDNTANNERYFPYVSDSTTNRYQVTGNTTGSLIETATTSYSYDNYGNATSIVTTRTDKDGGSLYNGDSWTTTVTNTPEVDTTNWCLDLFTETQTAYSATVGNSVSVTKDLTPDTSHCRYTSIVTEPGNSSYQVTESLGYDDFGNISSDTVTGINMTGRTTSLGWGTTGQFPVSVTNAAGETTSLSYQENLGLLGSVTDPNGLTTSYSYDGFGRRTQENRPDGTYTQWTYNNCVSWGGCLLGSNTLALAHYVYNKDGTIQSDGTTYFDELERPFLANQMALASGTYNRTELRYDSLGRVTQVAFPCTWSSVTTTCPNWTTTTYDLVDRPLTVSRPINASDSTLQTTTYQYSGDTTTVTDPQGKTKTTISDPNGWLRQSTDGNGFYVTLGYDAAGSRTSVADSSGDALWSGTYAYGIQPFLISFSDADRGTWGYTVDALGERVAWTDAKGQSFSEAYDALSRPVTRSEPDLFTEWTYGASASAHNIDRLAGVCTGTGKYPTQCTISGYSESESYDAEGRLATRAIAIPNDRTYTYSWQYDPNTGLLATRTYPIDPSGFALKVQYGYSSGLLATVTDTADSPNVTLWTANAEDPRGQVTQATLGNGVVVNNAYDAVTGWLNGITAGVKGGTGLENYAYLYDKLGDLTQRQDNSQGLSENFYYDNDYRVTSATLNNTSDLAMSYAPNGSIDTYQSGANPTETFTYTGNQTGCSYYSNPQPHAVRSIALAGGRTESVCYDGNGNATALSLAGLGTVGTLGWTSYNQPSSYSGSDGAGGTDYGTFSYGPDHERWQYAASDVNPNGNSSVTTTYIGEDMEEVQTPLGTTYRNYVKVGRSVIVDNRSATGGGSLYYLLADPLGSVAKVTDSSGNLTVAENYDAWGAPRGDNWTGSPTPSEQSTAYGITAHGFTFQEFLPYMENFVNFNGRVYAYGAFISPDPIVQDPSNPQNYNRYGYALDNPLTYTDPSGFDTETSANSAASDSAMQTVDVTATRFAEPEPIGAVFILMSPDSPSGPVGTGNEFLQMLNQIADQALQDASKALEAAKGKGEKSPQKTPQAPQPQKPSHTQCTNGSAPSRVNAPNTGTHMITGLTAGATGGFVAGALVVANIIGFPEVEGGEALIFSILGGAGSDVVATGGLIGGMWGGGAGMMFGLMITAPSCGGGAGP